MTAEKAQVFSFLGCDIVIRRRKLPPSGRYTHGYSYAIVPQPDRRVTWCAMESKPICRTAAEAVTRAKSAIEARAKADDGKGIPDRGAVTRTTERGIVML